MLMKQPWMKGLYDLHVEKIQAEEEGKDLTPLLTMFDTLAQQPHTPEAFAQAEALYAQIQQLPTRPDYPYAEPSDLAGIQAQRCAPVPLPDGTLTEETLHDRILAAWQARSAGCLFGQPVEGWMRARIQGLLLDTGNWPVSRYIASDIGDALREKYDVSDDQGPYGARLKNWINNVTEMPVDDDTSYTVFSLMLLERHGRDFTPEQVGEEWLSSLPLLRTCTAERMAYINMANLILPPASATTHNPYREWIGAQIRADLYGYINPGNPQAAAEMAWRDASISHVKNGIYGAMYVAAMIAAAFVTDDAEQIVLAGLGQIPERSRLYVQAMELLAHFRAGKTVDAYLDIFYKQYDEQRGHDWCHTIPNALLVTAGLLFHKMEFAPSMAFGTTAGFDTDCNSATIGSIIGAAKGTGAIDSVWTDPLNDWINSFVADYGRIRITELAKRTMAFVEK